MNQVSWYLYYASALDNISTITGPAAFFAFFAFLCSIVGRVVVFIGSSQGEDDFKSFAPTMKAIFSRAFIAWVCAIAIYTAVPSKNTIYAIAASQIGEKAIPPEMMSDATKALHQWIKKQIDPQKN